MKELMRLMNLPRSFVSFTRTSDGFYLAQELGDIGFNVFLGRPSHHPGFGRDASFSTWRGFTFGQRRRAVCAARRMNMSLRDWLPRQI